MIPLTKSFLENRTLGIYDQFAIDDPFELLTESEFEQIYGEILNEIKLMDVDKLTEKFKMSEGEVKRKFAEHIVKAEKKFKKAGGDPKVLKKAKKLAKKHSKTAISEIKSGKKNSFIDAFKELFKEIRDTPLSHQMLTTGGTFVVCILLYFIFSVVTGIIFGLTGALLPLFFIASVIIIPIVGGIARYITVNQKSGGAALITFNATAILSGVLAILFVGFVPSIAIAVMIGLIVNTILFVIQKKFDVDGKTGIGLILTTLVSSLLAFVQYLGSGIEFDWVEAFSL